MYIVTNRELSLRAKGLNVFGSKPNRKGSNELRLVEVGRSGKKYSAKILVDELGTATKKKLKDEFKLEIDTGKAHYASLRVACDLMARAREEKKHVLFYVHGYNNDVTDIVQAALDLEATYNVIVVPFTWPANGGGSITGAAAYLSDKKDARASADALNSFIAKVHYYHALLTESRGRALWGRAAKKFPDNPQAMREHYAELQDRDCKVTLNLLCHSMGNYVLKQALRPSFTPARDLVFDNVCLVAADTNNENHADWAERIQFRNRLYITINENDFALKWSRRKPGSEQLARLGHYLKRLGARNAHYLDLTHADHVGSDHAYFKCEAVEKNRELRTLFARLFTGGVAEAALTYRADINAYRLG
jgi:esterase/lipase superfamily enzyme